MARFVTSLLLFMGLVLGSSSSHAQSLEKVSIQLKWFHQFQFAGYYAAKEKGYYAEEGLDVDIIERDPKKDNVNEVINGTTQYGVADAGLLVSRLQGKPVVLLSQIFQHSPLVFVTLRSSGLRTPFDLAGKTLMNDPAGNGDAPLKAMILNTLGGLDKVNWKKHNYKFNELIEGKVDAMFAYISNEPLWYRTRGEEVNIIDPRDHGIDFYGDNLFTSEKEVRDHPERVEKFRRASLKGWKYALDNKDEMIDLILRKYNANSKRSREHLRYEAGEIGKLTNHRFVEIGRFELTRFEKIAATYTQLGIIDKFKVDPKFFFQANEPSINLSTEEKAWLKDHPRLRVHNDLDWLPFNFNQAGRPKGYSIAYLNLLAKKLGVEIEYVSGPTWEEFLDMMRSKELDIISNIVQTKDRTNYLSFTNPFVENPSVIVTKSGRKDIKRLKDLAGKTVAIPRSYFYQEILERDYPQIKLVSVKNRLEALKAVSFKQADATLGGFAVSNYLIRQNGLSNLSVVGEVATEEFSNGLRIATHKDNTVLRDILQKAIETVTPGELAVIHNRWIGELTPKVVDEKGDSSSEILSLARNIGIGALVLVVLILILVMAVRMLDRKDSSRLYESREIRGFGVLVVCLFLVVVLTSAWFTVQTTDKRAREEIGNSLQTVLLSTNAALKVWVNGKRQQLFAVAEEFGTRTLVRNLLEIPRNREALQKSQSLEMVRGMFDLEREHIKDLGFFVISPDRINVGSMRNENLGQASLIQKNYSHLLDRVFQGESVLIPTMESDVPIKAAGGKVIAKAPTMFVAAPVHDMAKKNIVAAIAIRLDPLLEFSRIIQLGRIGASGETYAFDQNAKMISLSRFDDGMHKAKLLKPNLKSILNIDIRDPGGNILTGHPVPANPEKMGMTHMAADATLKRSGRDTSGYRDYRGVPVIGAWLWDTELGFGMTTEIDLDEGLNSFFTIRSIILAVLGITVLMAFILTGLSIWIGRSANRSLTKARDDLEFKVEERTAELKESQGLIKAVIDNIPAIIFLKKPDGTFQLVNQRYEELLGLKLENIKGKSLHDIFPKEQADLFSQYDRDLIASGKTREYEHIIESLGSELIFSNMMFQVLDENGDMTFYGGIEVDITERKQAEEQLRQARDAAEEATKAKATFLATMSHEIRTPMGGVIGMVDLLQQTKLDDDQKHMADTVRNSANSLLTIINDILDFSKIEAGKLDLEEVPISIRDAVEGVGEALAVNARNKNIRLAIFVDPNIPDAVIGDQVRVRQILFNLGGNAVKFTEKGKILIRADLLPSGEEDRVTIQFKIIDDGIGIPEEAQANLFTAFSQVEASTTRRFGGTGLGLSICQRLTELMKGEIGVESVPGEGSVFHSTITFPIAGEHTIKSDGQDLAGLNVLLAVQDVEMRELVPRYLEHWKASVTAVSDIDELETTALDAAAGGNPFDIIGMGSTRPLPEQISLVERLNKLEKLPSKRFVIACLNRDRSERKVTENTMYIDSDPLIRGKFIRTIAAASGRISPDVLYDEEDTPTVKVKAPSVAEAAAMGQLILLAEDNPTNQDVIGRQLNLLGYAFELANDGREALDMFESKAYAILLTDCHMPNMDGFELSQSIRNSETGSTDHLPIVAITASVMKEEIESCFSCGMDDYLPKPLEMPKLKDMLRKWIPEHETATAPAEPNKMNDAASDILLDDDAPIDAEALRSVFGDDEETFKEILNEFIEPAQDNVAEIMSAFEKQSIDGVAKAAHKLKSSSRAVGANDLSDLCLALESAGNEDDWNSIESAAPNLHDELTKVVDYINRL